MTQKTKFLLGISLLLLILGYFLHKPVLSTTYILLGEQKNVKRYADRGNLSEAQKKKLYQEACGYFLKAYQLDKKRFDYIKSGTAHDNCLDAGDAHAAGKFSLLQEQLPKRDASGNTRSSYRYR